tara:strand:+ start:10288 stop:11274 length:987 start_codon:yes stop_codon:yes gene_type:complete
LEAVRNITIALFLVSCTLLFIAADNLEYLKETFGVKLKENKDVSGSQEFLNSVFFSVDRENQPMVVNSKKVIVQNSSGKIILMAPFGSVISTDETFEYEGDSGEVIPSKDQINLFGKVKLKKTDLTITGEEMSVLQKSQKAVLKRSVNTRARTSNGNKIRLKSVNAHFDGELGIVRYEKNIRGNLSFANKSFSPPMAIQSEKLAYYLNSGKMILEDKVKIDRDNIHLTAQRGSIFLNKESRDVNYFELNDDVRFSEKFTASNGQSILRTGLSQKLEGFGFQRKLVFSGFPKLKQLDDLIQGNKIVIEESNELVEIINTNSKFKFNQSR